MGQLEGSIVLQGDMNAATLTARGGKHGEDKFDANGRRKADSVVHEQVFRYEQASGTSVVAESRVVGALFADATAVEVAIVCETKPDGTGGDPRKFTVDILKGNQSSAFASILPSATPITVDSTIANRQVQFVTPTTTTGARGDQIKITVSVSGTTGAQGQGLSVSVKYRENPA
ncbi:MAG: hypothetical protein DCC68_26770 [Planctomycetota bacterium]|nr:MAG: hypothetical protein DCC68_26770 [Planctomycetota bacterium]